MAEQQDVYITGHGLHEWARESTQKQIDVNLKQIMADNNAMLRYTHAIANNDKNANKILHTAVTAIRENTNAEKKGNQTEKQTGNKLINSQQKISSSSLASISAITGIGDTILDSERKQRKRDEIRDALLNANYSQEEAERGANRKMQVDLWKNISTKMIAFVTATKSLTDMFTGAAEQGFAERYAMVAEMRQAGLLAGMEGAEAGFIEMQKTISATNFTFGEATQFTKQFAKAVGVNGVKSALTFANTVAKATADGGMDYMRRYALEFGQVSNIAGEYLDTLRIGGQLRGMDDRSMRSGMEDFMSNVEMTSNVLKISMEDAADLMKKAFGAEDVALLATLPAEQRDAIEEGFLAMGAQGNPMAETLAKRLAAGSRGAFLQTAEYQEMAGTAPGREVLDFVEQMAQTLENGDTESFQSALADGFPQLADRLIELSSRGGVRIQLLNEPQLASMVGQIIEAAQTYGQADRGTEMGTQQAAEQAQIGEMMQIREALVTSEAAMNVHMAGFVQNVKDITAENRRLAMETGRVLAAYTGIVGMATDVGTWIEVFKKGTFAAILEMLPKSSLDPHLEAIFATQGQFAPGKWNAEETDENIDNQLKDMKERYEELSTLSVEERKAEQLALTGEVKGLMMQIAAIMQQNESEFNKEEKQIFLENANNVALYAEKLNAFTTKLDQ